MTETPRPPAAALDAAPFPSRARFRVVALTLLLVGVAYLDRVCISSAGPTIQRELGLGDAEMGFVFSAFTFAYALFEIPGGWFADRFGARVALTRIVVWWSIMTAATGLAGGFLSLVAVRLLFGVGEAGAFPATARVYARWLPPKERGRAFGLAIMTGALTGAATQPLVVSLLSVVGWRTTFVLFGALGLAWALGWWIYFRDDPNGHRGVNQAEREAIGVEPRADFARHEVPWSLLVRSRTLLALCSMYAGTIYGWYFYLTWLPTYLQRARHFNLKDAGMLAALPLVSIAAGVYCGGWLTDWLPRHVGRRTSRRTQGLVGLPIAALSVVCAILTESPLHAACFLSAAAGFAAVGVAPAWAVCLEIGGGHAGIVSGTMNTFGNLGGALSPVVVGLCLRYWGSWNAPLYSMAAMYLVAALSWLAVEPDQTILRSPPAEGDERGRRRGVLASSS